MSMSAVFITLMLVCMAAVLGVLATGIIVMARGGEANRKYGNKLMQWRVICQGAALLFFVLAVMARGS